MTRRRAPKSQAERYAAGAVMLALGVGAILLGAVGALGYFWPAFAIGLVLVLLGIRKFRPPPAEQVRGDDGKPPLDTGGGS